MSYYYNYYLGYVKDGRVFPLGPFDYSGKLKALLSRSRSFASDLHDRFFRIKEEMISDELRHEFEYEDYEGGIQMQNIHTLMLDELPKGSYIKSGYFLIEDVERYMHTGDSDSFYDRKDPAVFAAILQSEAVLGAPPTKYDLEGNPYPIRSAADYMYFAYPDYQSEAYEAFLIRQFAEALERYPDIEFDSIIVLETEG